MAAVPDREAVPVTQVRFSSPSIVLVGNEGNGLSDEAVEAADLAVRIPMAQGVESLNAAVAGGVLLWHFRGV